MSVDLPKRTTVCLHAGYVPRIACATPIRAISSVAPASLQAPASASLDAGLTRCSQPIGHNKTPPKASTTPSSPSSPPPRSKSRASSSQAVSRDVNRDSAKARSSPPCDSHVGVDYPDPEPFPHGFAPETNYGLPLDTLNRASIVRPTPELLEGLGLCTSPTLAAHST